MTLYIVTSDEGAERYGAELNATVDRDLDPEEDIAVVCAGWLTPVTPKEEG